MLAQLKPQEQGDFFIRIFTPREYGWFHQNWGVVQDQRGLIYVANSNGVLEYDSVRWRLIRTDSGAMVRSLAVDATGRIYVGAQGEFGYLAPNAVGEMRFVSLMDRVAPEDRDIADISSICFLGKRVYFQYLARLFCLSDNQVKVWKPAKSFQVACTIQNRLYLQDIGRGLLVFDGDALKPVPGGEYFIDKRIIAILPWAVPGAEKNDLMICTQNQGLFLSAGQTIKPFPTQADGVLREAQLYHALLLADGTLGVATIQGGFLHISRAGQWLGWIGEREGLPIESVKYLFQDSQQGLWMALQKGISRVEISSPLTCFDGRRGLPGTVATIQRHQGILYAGTSQGLYRLNSTGPRGPYFSPVDGIKGSVWNFLSWEERLLVANYDGVFEVRDTRAVPIRKSAVVTYCLLRSRKDPERLFIGLQNGLASCRRESGRWVDKGLLVDKPIIVRTIYEADDGSLWIGTHSQGVFHISFPAGLQHGNARVESFGKEQGLPSLSQTYLFKLASGLKATSTAGIYRYREDSNRFELDPAFSGFFPTGERLIYNLKEDNQSRVWMHTRDERRNINESGAAVPQPDGTYRWEGRPCVRFSGNWATTIFPEADGVVWFGTIEGLMRLDTKIPKPYNLPCHTLIRRVSSGNSRLIFGGTWPGPIREPRIPYTGNHLHFEFAAPSFDMESANRYQVLLEGYDSAWSEWSTEAFKDYTNLSEGSYHFRVRSRNLYGTMSCDDIFAFRVLPPWYRTWWAYLLWVIGAAVALVGIIYLYTLRLRRQKYQLENIVAERTQELRQTSEQLRVASEQLREASLTDPLTGLRNRRFIAEVLQNDIAAFIGFKNYVLTAKKQRRGEAEDAVFGLFLLDIDFFKKVNDTYGHDAGDQVLKQFAAILKSSVRQDDAVMRVGGEEFLVVLKKTRPEYLSVFAAKVLEKVAATPFGLGDGMTIRKTCSIGYTRFPLFPEQPGLLSFEQSIMVADLGLLHAKDHGRNQGVCLEAGPNTPSGKEILQKTVTSLDFALKEGYLRIDNSSNRPSD